MRVPNSPSDDAAADVAEEVLDDAEEPTEEPAYDLSDAGEEDAADATAPVAQPWERLPKEGTIAWNCFTRYRDLLGRRTLLLAFQQETGKKEARAPNGAWTSWYTRFNWKARAAAYDAHLDKIDREKNEKAHFAELEAYRNRQRQLASAGTQLSILLLQKVTDRVKKLEPDEIPIALIPQYLRSATGAAQMAMNAEAEAIGLDDLIKQLDEQNGETKQPD